VLLDLSNGGGQHDGRGQLVRKEPIWLGDGGFYSTAWTAYSDQGKCLLSPWLLWQLAQSALTHLAGNGLNLQTSCSTGSATVSQESRGNWPGTYGAYTDSCACTYVCIPYNTHRPRYTHPRLQRWITGELRQESLSVPRPAIAGSRIANTSFAWQCVDYCAGAED
jgi:hypothetical protein